MTLAQNLILLLVTAALTGLLTPIVKDSIDRRKLAKQSEFEDQRLRAQKRFEAELARQTKVIDAQAELLDELATVLWAFEKLVLRVTFYGGGGDWDKFAASLGKWDNEAWDLLAGFLAATSKARRLAPPEAHQQLQELYRELVEQVAPRIDPMRAFKLDAAGKMSVHQREMCRQVNRYVYDDIAPRIDDVLARICGAFQLAAT